MRDDRIVEDSVRSFAAAGATGSLSRCTPHRGDGAVEIGDLTVEGGDPLARHRGAQRGGGGEDVVGPLATACGSLERVSVGAVAESTLDRELDR
ncbi:hypothetical protein [Nocardia vinacea]|uniref:hypothetical protein n=1 Tax=Nocardia vinacea TaxID=96468 RepID=UPI0002E8672D|nr:hypothetical protein [Nocardia vinacea]